MQISVSHIAISIFSVLIISFLAQKLFIYLAHRFQLVAKPDQRRRHARVTPSIGGVGVMVGWIAGLIIYGFLEPEWPRDHLQSIVTIVTSAIVLNLLGLWDDIVNAGPYSKLLVQSLVGIGILAFEPNIHGLLSYWQGEIGPLSWAFGFFWIVGITNSINLIDGIDGLAGGTSIIAGLALLVLLSWSGEHAHNAAIQITLLIPALATFMIFNWNPAKVFLGDNGSLPVGMILSSASLMGHAHSKSWVMLLSLVLIFGYPILDLTICVFRRYRNRQPLFKGDRIHLHFRIAKLGLSTRQTTTLLLVIGAYMQLAALTVNLLSPPVAMLGLLIVFFSIFTLLFLVRSIEGWKVSKLFSYIEKQRSQSEKDSMSHWTISIDLTPIIEKSSSHVTTEKTIRALESLIRSLIRESDTIVLADVKLIVVLKDPNLHEENVEMIKARFQEKTNSFISLFNVECATSSLTITSGKQLFIHQAQTATPIRLIS